MSVIQAPPPAPASRHLPHDPASNAALVALYSAALGHGRKDRYLRRFAQFDAAGHISPGWNGAASLCTLGWALLRQLWVPALLYVAVVEGLALLALGPGRWLLQEQPDLQWPLLAAIGVLAWVLPGMYGDALLHTEIRKRIVTALAQTQSVAEACTVLSHTASSRERLQGLALANAAVVLAAAAISVWQPWNSRAAFGAAPPSATARPANTRPANPKAPELTVGEALAQARSASALLTAAVPTPESLPAPVLAVASPADPVQNTTVPSAAPAAPASESSPPATGAEAPLTPYQSVAVTGVPTRSEPAAVPSKPARTPVVNTNTAPEASGAKPGYYLNAGLFAEEANARKVQAQLLNANLPAFRQRLDTAQGPRTRVRVGPFTTLQQAQATHATLRGMGLEAVVFRQ